MNVGGRMRALALILINERMAERFVDGSGGGYLSGFRADIVNPVVGHLQAVIVLQRRAVGNAQNIADPIKAVTELLERREALLGGIALGRNSRFTGGFGG